MRDLPERSFLSPLLFWLQFFFGSGKIVRLHLSKRNVGSSQRCVTFYRSVRTQVAMRPLNLPWQWLQGPESVTKFPHRPFPGIGKHISFFGSRGVTCRSEVSHVVQRCHMSLTTAVIKFSARKPTEHGSVIDQCIASQNSETTISSSRSPCKGWASSRGAFRFGMNLLRSLRLLSHSPTRQQSSSSTSNPARSYRALAA
jgi:hypothetical protein